MNVVATLYRVTKELYDILSESFEKEARDERIDRISELLNARDSLIQEIKPPYTDNEKALGGEIVRLNALIEEKLVSLKNDIQLDIIQLKKSKQSTHKYVNPYQSAPADGMFFDKRK